MGNWEKYYTKTYGSIGNGDNETKQERVNFNRLNFTHFIAQANGVIIGCAKDEHGSELTYAIAKDGSVKYRKNQGTWGDLSVIDCASIRYFAGRFYNRGVPTYQTRHQLVYR